MGYDLTVLRRDPGSSGPGARCLVCGARSQLTVIAKYKALFVCLCESHGDVPDNSVAMQRLTDLCERVAWQHEASGAPHGNKKGVGE